MNFLWVVIACVAIAAMLLVHLRWRRRYEELNARSIRAVAEAEKRNALEQEEWQRRQEVLFNSMTEGVLLLDNQERITLANRAFHELFKPLGEVRSRTLIESVRIHELASIPGQLNAASPVLEKELNITWPKERCLLVSAARVPGSHEGSYIGTVLVFHDLTRLKQLENARKDFVANVSHELRTPLSLVKGYVETLLDGAKEDPNLTEKFLRTIQRNADRLHELIEDLLVISELESARVSLNLEPIELNKLTQKVVDDFQAKAAPRQMRIIDDTQDLAVRGDAGRLEQVLANLIDNALKYGKTGGFVRVSARPIEHGMVEVAVADDGPGVPPESLPRLFERFYRVDKARSREQGGTGLGLSIVKHIVQSHGGKVWATSVLGQGATFYFTLPAAGKAAEAAAGEPATSR